jgi:hypothetical protein
VYAAPKEGRAHRTIIFVPASSSLVEKLYRTLVARSGDFMDITLFLLQLAAMLTIAVVSGQLMRRLGQPAVIGELIGGVILGPTLFGMLFPCRVSAPVRRG